LFVLTSVANVVLIFEDVLLRMKCQMISAGLSSGDFDGNGMSVNVTWDGKLDRGGEKCEHQERSV